MREMHNVDREGRKLIYGREPSKPQYHEYPREKTFPTEEDMACEAQLSALGTWEPLRLKIRQGEWKENERSVKDLWRPFQPKEGILNDRESILLYGAKGSQPTDPCGLAQMARHTGIKPREDSMTYPTSAAEMFTCLHDVFDTFDFGRTFAVRLNQGGHYPPHRDHILLTRPTFRLIAFLGDSTGPLKWEVEDKRVTFQPNHLYYVDTRKTHSLWSGSHKSTMVVFNVMKNWENVMKILTNLKYRG
jgi:hypothetical protein